MGSFHLMQSFSRRLERVLQICNALRTSRLKQGRQLALNTDGPAVARSGATGRTVRRRSEILLANILNEIRDDRID